MGIPKKGTPKNKVGILIGTFGPKWIYSKYIPTMFLGFPTWGSHSSPNRADTGSEPEGSRVPNYSVLRVSKLES